MTSAQVIVLATPVFLALIALEFWVGVRRGRNTYRLNDALSSIGLGIMSQLIGVFSGVATLGLYSLVFGALAWRPWPVDALWTWLVALLLYDLCYYWKHRFGHTVALLWAAHVVHHQSEDYNLSTALRQTSSDWLFGWLFYLPLAVLGVPPLVFATVALIDLLYQYWVHTQQIGKLGWFDRWFCSPSNHRVHHAVNDRYLDKNYGGILIVWDRLFGSFAEEDLARALRLRHARAAAKLEPAVGEPAHLSRPARRRVACELVGRQAQGVRTAPRLAPGRRGAALAPAGVRDSPAAPLRPAAVAPRGKRGGAALRAGADRHGAVPLARAPPEPGAATARLGRDRAELVRGGRVQRVAQRSAGANIERRQ